MGTDMKTKLFRTFIALAIAGAVTSAFGQSTTAHDPSMGNPYIKVPRTSTYIPGVPRTHYLIYTGVPASSGGTLLAMHGPALLAPIIPGYHPDQIRTAYGLPSNGGIGAIAIVDLNNLTSALGDFNFFAQTFGLPQEPSSDPTNAGNKVFQVVYAEGSKPPDDNTGWGGEIALDIEWAHAMAPNAKIYLVESNGDLDKANQVAAKVAGVREVSNSWGYPGEISTATLLDANYVYPGVVFLASSGDFGGVTSYPATSPNVVGIGGTSMILGSSNEVVSETAWDGSGGGPSLYETRPDFQNAISGIVGPARGSPDVAAIADPYTGVAVYSSTAYGTSTGWAVIGGTSVACPVTAGITNLRGNGTTPPNFTSSSHRELLRVYYNLLGAYYNDITKGSAGGFMAKTGWDFTTGIGRPIGLFPNYTPPFTVPTNNALKFQGTTAVGSLANLVAIDGFTYNLGTTLTSVGQSAALEVDFKMDR